jgi:hypothetical protein
LSRPLLPTTNINRSFSTGIMPLTAGRGFTIDILLTYNNI